MSTTENTNNTEEQNTEEHSEAREKAREERSMAMNRRDLMRASAALAGASAVGLGSTQTQFSPVGDAQAVAPVVAAGLVVGGMHVGAGATRLFDDESRIDADEAAETEAQQQHSSIYDSADQIRGFVEQLLEQEFEDSMNLEDGDGAWYNGCLSRSNTAFYETLQEGGAKSQGVSDARQRVDTYLSSVVESVADVWNQIASEAEYLKFLAWQFEESNDDFAANSSFTVNGSTNSAALEQQGGAWYGDPEYNHEEVGMFGTPHKYDEIPEFDDMITKMEYTLWDGRTIEIIPMQYWHNRGGSVYGNTNAWRSEVYVNPFHGLTELGRVDSDDYEFNVDEELITNHGISGPSDPSEAEYLAPANVNPDRETDNYDYSPTITSQLTSTNSRGGSGWNSVSVIDPFDSGSSVSVINLSQLQKHIIYAAHLRQIFNGNIIENLAGEVFNAYERGDVDAHDILGPTDFIDMYSDGIDGGELGAVQATMISMGLATDPDGQMVKVSGIDDVDEDEWVQLFLNWDYTSPTLWNYGLSSGVFSVERPPEGGEYTLTFVHDGETDEEEDFEDEEVVVDVNDLDESNSVDISAEIPDNYVFDDIELRPTGEVEAYIPEGETISSDQYSSGGYIRYNEYEEAYVSHFISGDDTIDLLEVEGDDEYSLVTYYSDSTDPERTISEMDRTSEATDSVTTVSGGGGGGGSDDGVPMRKVVLGGLAGLAGLVGMGEVARRAGN